MDIVEGMLDYIYENGLSDEYLIKIGIPTEVVHGEPIWDKEGFKLKILLSDYLDEIVDEMILYLYEGKNIKISDIKLSTMINEFSLPVCPFWLTFCEAVKLHVCEEVYT